MPKKLIPFLLGLALLPALANAQISTEDDIVDRVLAIVGDSVVLQSQVMEAVQRIVMMQSMAIPEPGPELDQLMSDMLQQLVNTALISQEAARDSLITVDDELIEERVTEEIDRVTQQVGGQPALQQTLAGQGLTLAEYRGHAPQRHPSGAGAADVHTVPASRRGADRLDGGRSAHRFPRRREDNSTSARRW